MPFLGDIAQATGYTITITDASTNVGITVFNIRRDRISEVEIIKLVPAPDGSATTGLRPIASNVGRVVITAAVLNGSTAKIDVNGTTINMAPETTVTFDVV